MSTKILIYGIIVLVIVLAVFLLISIEPAPTKYLTREEINVNISHAGLSETHYGGGSFSRSFSASLEINNNAGFDLNNIYIYKIEVINDNVILGSFRPEFYISRDCSNKQIHDDFQNFNLSDKCKLTLVLKASDNIPDLEAGSKIRFRFLNEDYYTDFYEEALYFDVGIESPN
tara:strand:- start:55 stop:573 length:519 start_codon:yes stop_codon:yes gene_type:complete